MRPLLLSFTLRGWAMLVSGGLMAFSSWLFGERGIMPVGILLILLPVLAAWRVERGRRSLAVQRIVTPARAPVGSDIEVRVEVVAASGRASTLLAEDQLPAVLGGPRRFVFDSLQAGVPRATTYGLRAERRGKHVIGPLSVSVMDPFGLSRRQHSFEQTSALLITPQIDVLPPSRVFGDWASGGDGRSAAMAHRGDDDIVPREYRHGDDLRRMHWRASARAGSLMVRREEQPRRSSATLLVDLRSRAHTGRDGDSSLEQSLSWAASIGTHVIRAGSGLSVIDHAGRALLPPDFDGDREGALLEGLALAETYSESRLDPAQQVSASGALFALTGRLNATDAAALIGLAPGGASVALALGELDAATREAHRLLIRAGWRVVRPDPAVAKRTVWAELGSTLRATP